MAAPTSPPPTVCAKPSVEDAVPATAPSGSMAIELKFAPTKPKSGIIISEMRKNNQNGTGPAAAMAARTSAKHR
jgi:hypothetical protein